MEVRKLERAAETLRTINAIVRFTGNILATILMLAGFLLACTMSLSGIEAAADRAADAMEGWLANDDSGAE